MREAIAFAQNHKECDDVTKTINFDLFVTAAELAAKANMVKPNPRKLTEQEMAAIHLYTQESPFYEVLNQKLRIQDRKALVPFFPMIKLLMGALYKLPRHKGVVHRAIKTTVNEVYGKNSSVLWWGFSSSTGEKALTEKFCGDGGTYFEIGVSRGVDVSGYSAFPHEQEIILLPGTWLVVKDRSSSLAKGRDIVILEENAAAPCLLDFPHPEEKVFEGNSLVFGDVLSLVSSMRDQIKQRATILIIGNSGNGKSSLVAAILGLKPGDEEYKRLKISSEGDGSKDLTHFVYEDRLAFLDFRGIQPGESGKDYAERFFEEHAKYCKDHSEFATISLVISVSLPFVTQARTHDLTPLADAIKIICQTKDRPFLLVFNKKDMVVTTEQREEANKRRASLVTAFDKSYRRYFFGAALQVHELASKPTLDIASCPKPREPGDKVCLFVCLLVFPARRFHILCVCVPFNRWFTMARGRRNRRCRSAFLA